MGVGVSNRLPIALSIVLAIVLALLAGPAAALGLGQIQVKSQIGQPLLAEIPIISSDPAELEQLQARLASPETFAPRSAWNRPRAPPPTCISAVALDARGRPVIRVTSSRAGQPAAGDLPGRSGLGQRPPGARVLGAAGYAAHRGRARAAADPGAGGRAVRTSIERPVAAAPVPPPPRTRTAPPTTEPAPPRKPSRRTGARRRHRDRADAGTRARAGARRAPAGTRRRRRPTASPCATARRCRRSPTTLDTARLHARPDDARAAARQSRRLHRGNINLLKPGAVLRVPPAQDVAQLSASRGRRRSCATSSTQWRAMRAPAPQPAAVADAGIDASTPPAPTASPQPAGAARDRRAPGNRAADASGATTAGSRSGAAPEARATCCDRNCNRRRKPWPRATPRSRNSRRASPNSKNCSSTRQQLIEHEGQRAGRGRSSAWRRPTRPRRTAAPRRSNAVPASRGTRQRAPHGCGAASA